VPGTMGRTEQKGIDDVAARQFKRGDVHCCIVGHTHRARATESARFRTINTGTWTGYIEWSDVDTYNVLCEKADKPLVHPTYAYCDLQQGKEYLLDAPVEPS
jgi:predicted phosphodiesterase